MTTLQHILSPGKKFVAQKEAKTTMFENPEDQGMETEWDEILTAASEEELVRYTLNLTPFFVFFIIFFF